MFTKQTEQTIVLYAAIIGLVCLLTYTFVHTGALLARYVSPAGFGYLCAFGVEMLIAGISYRLATLRKHQTKSPLLLFVLIAALLVSAFANVYEGHATRYDFDLNWSNIGETDPIQAFIGLSATGLISLLVFAVSEIIGSDANAIAKANEREQRRIEHRKRKSEQTERNPKQAQQTPQTNYGPAVFAHLDRAYENGGRPNTLEEIPVRPTAEIIGCAPATAKKHIERWFNDGQ